jgi:predicted nucleic acid-binding Zn ribbon protein
MAPRRSAAPKETKPPKVRTHPCFVCQGAFPRDRLVYNRIYRGFRGRPNNASVLMCPDCSARIDEHWRKEAQMQKMFMVGGLGLMALLAFIFYLIRGY